MHQPRLICASPKPYQQNARQNPCAVRTPPASPRPGRYDGSRMRTAPVSRPAMPKQPMRREKHQLHHLTARHLQLSAARPRSPTQLIPGDAPIIGCRPQYPLHREDPPGQRRTAGQTAKGSPQSRRATEAVAPRTHLRSSAVSNESATPSERGIHQPGKAGKPHMIAHGVRTAHVRPQQIPHAP